MNSRTRKLLLVVCAVIMVAFVGRILVVSGLIPSPLANGINQLTHGNLPVTYARDMWGTSHNLSDPEWILFDYLHAAGCGYCVLNAHAYQENFADGFAASGVRTFGVDIYENQRDLIDYVKHHRIRYPMLTEPDALWKKCPGIPGQALFKQGSRVKNICETVTGKAYQTIAAILGENGLSRHLRPFRPMGPIKKAFVCVYEDEQSLVVVPDDESLDPQNFFSGLNSIRFKIKHASDVTEDDLSANTLYLIGGLANNSLIKRVVTQTPFVVENLSLSVGDTTLTGDDLRLRFCWPNPWNRERYVLIDTGTGAKPNRNFAYLGGMDYVISRKPATREAVKDAIIGYGIFAKKSGDWSLSANGTVWSSDISSANVSAPVARCGSGGCQAPKVTDRDAGNRSLSQINSTVEKLDAGGTSAVNENEKHQTSADSFHRIGPVQIKQYELGRGRFPAIVAASPDTCWIAWGDPAGDLFAGRLAGASLSPVTFQTQYQNVLSTGYKPSICLDSSNSCWIAWSAQINNYYQIVAASVEENLTAAPLVMSHIPNLDHSGPALTASSDSGVVLTWNCWRANSRRGYHRSWQKGQWLPTQRTPECGSSGFAWYHSGVGLTQITPGAPHKSIFTWMQHYPVPTGVFAAAYTDGDWQTPATLSETGRSPSIAAAPNGNETWVVWQERNDSHHPYAYFDWTIHYSQSDGIGWTAAQPIPNCPAGRNSSPVITVDGHGRRWLAWSHQDHPAGSPKDKKEESNPWRMLYAMYDQSGWHGPFALSTGELDARSPAITSSGTSIYITWHQGIGTTQKIILAHLEAKLPVGDQTTHIYRTMN